MTTKIKNPFVIGRYVSAEYFRDRCRRPTERDIAFNRTGHSQATQTELPDIIKDVAYKK